MFSLKTCLLFFLDILLKLSLSIEIKEVCFGIELNAQNLSQRFETPGYFKYKHRTLELWRTKLVQEVFKEDGECSDTRRSLYSRWNLLWIAAPSIRKRAIEVSRHYIVKQRILIIASAYSLHTHFCFHSVNYWFCKQCLCLQTEILVHFLKKPMKITRICLIFLQGNIEANFTYTTMLFI